MTASDLCAASKDLLPGGGHPHMRRRRLSPCASAPSGKRHAPHARFGLPPPSDCCLLVHRNCLTESFFVGQLPCYDVEQKRSADDDTGGNTHQAHREIYESAAHGSLLGL